MEQRKPGVRATVESLVDAWQSGDALRAAAHFAAAGAYREAGGSVVNGRDALVAHFTRFFRDGPRWRFEIDDLLVDEPRACVVYRFAVEGSGGIWRERAGCAIATLDADGAVAEWREYEG
jgi:uncharacterized protein (TIGR02246 family)